MREIVTVQAGDFANYIGSNFWNIQDELLGLSEERLGDSIYKKMPLDMDTYYRTGETQQGTLTYCPRLLSIGTQGSLGSLSSAGSLYHDTTPCDLTNIHTWNGGVSRLASELHKKNLFLQSLHEEEQGEGSQNLKAEVYDKDLVECLENGVQFWTDFSKVHYHPRSLCELHSSWTVVQKHDNYGTGEEVLSDGMQMEDMNERLRFFVEECDHIQGIQFIVDDSGGFSSVASDFLENIADEYANTPVLLFSARKPNVQMKVTNKDTVTRALHDAISFSRLSSLCKLMVPVGLPLPSQSKLSSCLHLEDKKLYHCSAVYAASIHSISIPFRMATLRPTANSLYCIGAMDVSDLTQFLSGQARQNMVSILDTAMPAPALSVEQKAVPFLRYLHSLTPEIDEDVEDPTAVESLMVHGAYHSGGHRATISQARDSISALYQSKEVQRPLFTRFSAALCPLPIPLPFPSIFRGHVGRKGEFQVSLNEGAAAGPKGSLDVESVPMAVRLRSSRAVKPYIERRLANLGKFGMERGAPGGELLRSWGFGREEVAEMGEAMARMVQQLDPHIESGSDSD